LELRGRVFFHSEAVKSLAARASGVQSFGVVVGVVVGVEVLVVVVVVVVRVVDVVGVVDVVVVGNK